MRSKHAELGHSVPEVTLRFLRMVLNCSRKADELALSYDFTPVDFANINKLLEIENALPNRPQTIIQLDSFGRAVRKAGLEKWLYEFVNKHGTSGLDLLITINRYKN